MSYFRVSILPHPNPDKPEKSKRTAKRAKNAKKIFLNLAHLAAFAVRKFLHKKQGFNFKGTNFSA